EWKRIRTITSPSFTSGKLRAMMGSIGGIADQFVNNLDEYAAKRLICANTWVPLPWYTSRGHGYHICTSANKRSDFIQLMIDNEKNDKNFDSDYNSDEDINVNQLQESTETVIKSSQTLTSDELTAQGILFFIAGYDTTKSKNLRAFLSNGSKRRNRAIGGNKTEIT
ncbi:unnamed protein product, partial [Oppiella nova]